MKKRELKVAMVVLLAVVFMSWAFHYTGKPALAKLSGAAGKTPLQQAANDTLPEIILSPSCIGEVQFPHKYHYEEMEIECSDCHHETNATTLETPHDEYFEDFWIDCAICHQPNGKTVTAAQSCSSCHHSKPSDIADETLSAKVVIHESCWDCHGVGTGKEASSNCAFCHVGERSKHR